MLSNEGSRQSDRIREGKSAPALKESVIKESVEGQKKSLIMDVMEARLSRLQNYKLALDTKLFKEKEYTSRVKEIQEFLKKIATTNDPKAIEAASFHLSLDDGQLIRDQLLPQWSKGVIDMQKVALTLMRGDNGTEQVEKIAANTLGDLFSQGVTKLNTDAKAKSDIVRRANKHFGEMMAQGSLDNATPEQQNAARAGLEAMYQMRYIAKEYIGETGGIAVPAGLQVVWGNYRDSMDIKNEWFNWSDTGKTQIASFLLYDLAPMIISGGVAGAVGKGVISIASRMPAIVNYANSGTKIAKVVSVGARAGLAVTEAAAFDLTFEGLRNQRLFTNKPHWQQDLIKNSFGFGFSRYLAGATKFAGIPLDPLSNQLVKQGLIVPAIITGVGVGQKLMANDPDAYDGAWEEFLLGAIMTGAFHMTGKVLESKYPAKETGIQKLEISPDGKKVDITIKDGKKYTTKVTDKLKSLWPKGNETKSNPRKPTPDITDVEVKAPKTNAPAQKTADAPTTQKPTDAPAAPATASKDAPLQLEWSGKKTQKIKAEAVEENAKPNPRKATPDIENAVIKEPKKPQAENLSSSDRDIQIQGLKNEINAAETGRIQVTPEFISLKKQKLAQLEGITSDLAHTSNSARARLESIPKGTGETGIKIGDTEYMINRHKDSKIDVTSPGKEVKTYTSIDEFLGTLKSENKLIGTKKETTVDKTGDTPKTPAEGEKGTVKANDVTGKQSTSSHSDTIDLGAQARIDAEHGIGRKGLTQADLLEGGSFRSEMDAMMKMDDATFLSGVDRSPGLSYGKEMYAAAAKVRKMSDAEVLSAAIKGPNGTPILNRSGRHPKDLDTTITKLEKNLDADRVSLQSMKNNGLDHADMQAKVRAGENLLNELKSKKASIVAENAALRSRLSDIINKKAPGLADAIIAKEPNKVLELLKRYGWVIPVILLALFGLSKCNGGKGTGDTSTPEALAADLCGTDSGKAKGDIIDGRKSDAGATLTEKRRESISQKWMKTPKWKALVVEFRKNEELLKDSRFADAFNAMLRNPTVSGVQHIQRWVGMEGVDNKQNQDGILGAITTDAISKFIEKCQTTKSVPSLVDQIPKPAPRATPAPVAPAIPDTAPQYSDPMGNSLGNPT